jgi:ACS family D-galactonate transporter-like MFS transporter
MSRTRDDSRALAAFAPGLVLIAAAFLINYIDRGNISVGADLIRKEFHLSDSQLGILFAAFFTTYTAMQFVLGWMVDRFDANRILAAGFLLWSLATATTGFVRGFALLLSIRFILGIGEAVALPCGAKILARHLPEHHRGWAAGALMCSLRFGNAAGTLGAGMLMAKFGWRPVFIGIGLLSLLWLPAWVHWRPRGGRELPRIEPRKGIGWAILQRRSFWGTSAGHFASNYLFYFMITWLPQYLQRGRNLPLATMSVVAGLYYAFDGVSAVSTGWLQDLWIRKGRTPTFVRKAAMAIGFSMAGVAIIGCALAGQHSYLPWLLAAGWGCGMTGPGLYTFPQRLAGPEAVGKWYGWQNGFANTAGVIGPALTGFVLEHTGTFFTPFAITAGICVIGVVAWVWVVGRVEPVSWSLEREAVIASARVSV